ncbi:HIT domain protein, partial [Coelomomyces lativittatus]
MVSIRPSNSMEETVTTFTNRPMKSMKPNQKQSLSTADSILHKFKTKIQFFDEQIEKHLLQQTTKSKNNTEELEKVTKAMQDLCLSIVSIKEKSMDAEQVVQNMTHDIKSLDLAKKNLIHSITISRRLAMFNTAMTQLKSNAFQKQYKQVALLFK